jgi:hypothetical protein
MDSFDQGSYDKRDSYVKVNNMVLHILAALKVLGRGIILLLFRLTWLLIACPR